LLTTTPDWCHLVRVGKNYGREATVRGEHSRTNDSGTVISSDWSSAASTAVTALPASDRRHVASVDWSGPVFNERSNPTTMEHMLQDPGHKEVNVDDELGASEDVTSRPIDLSKSRRDSAVALDTKTDELVSSKLTLCRIGNSYRQRPSDTSFTASTSASDQTKTTVPDTPARSATVNQHWKRLSDTTVTPSSPSDKGKTTISQATINRLSTPKHMTLRGEQSRPCSPTKPLLSPPSGAHRVAEPGSQGTLRGSAPAYEPTASTLRRTKHKDLRSGKSTLQHDPAPASIQSSPATSLYATYRSKSFSSKDIIQGPSAPTDAIESHALFSQSIDPDSAPISTCGPLFPIEAVTDAEDEEDATGEDLNKEDLNKEDLNKEDLNKEDLNKEDLNKEDLNKEDLNKEDLNEDLNEEDPNIALAARISTLTRTFVKEYVSIVKGVAGVTYAELHAHMFQALEAADGTTDGKTILVDEERLEELRREWYGLECGGAGTGEGL